LTDRITSEWTDTLAEAFGNTHSIANAVIAEEMYYQFAIRTYADVQYMPSDRSFQTRGIDLLVKQASWPRFYAVDVKANMHGIKFWIDNRESGWLRNPQKRTDIIVHIDVDSKHALQYTRQDMIVRLNSYSLKRDFIGATIFGPIVHGISEQFELE
jgi:hypothetical protein